VNTPGAAMYRNHALAAVPRLLGSLDREAFSPTAGSFDRDHWGWHFRDVPIGMLQTGMLPMASLWSREFPGNPYYRSGRLLGWITLSIEHTLRRQHRNGSFDSVGPFTQDHGVTLQAAYLLCTALRSLGDAIPADLAHRMTRAVRGCCDFAARSDEDYAFISNHRALFALAWLRAGELLGDAALRERAEREVGAIIDRQAPEGWYPEYDGADPGYQSLGMSYLVQFQVECPSSRLAESLRRAVEFISFFVHPDGGVGGVYGSRMTSLWFPSGFESLAAENVLAAAIADKTAEGIASNNVVTPASSDAHNLAVILQSYLLAADARSSRGDLLAGTGAPSLPAADLMGIRSFGTSGLVVAGRPRYYAVVNARRGGVGSIYSRLTRQLVFEDAGLIVRGDRLVWSSAQAIGAEVTGPDPSGKVTIRQFLGEVNRVALTPGRFLLLRLLNLTAFRSVTVGAWIRRRIVDRLISRREAGPISLQREILFKDASVQIRDQLKSPGPMPVLGLFRSRSYSAVHMGSSRYYHSRELDGPSDTAEPIAREALGSSGVAELNLEISFGDDGQGPATSTSPAGR
jgi:hypothetical protein